MRAPPVAGPRTLTLTGAWGGGRQRFPLMAGSWLPRSRSPGCPTLRESRWEDSLRYGQNSRPRAQRSLVVPPVRRCLGGGGHTIHARGPAAGPLLLCLVPGACCLVGWGTYHPRAGRPRACSSSASAGGTTSAVARLAACFHGWLMVRSGLLTPGRGFLEPRFRRPETSGKKGAGRRGEDR